MSNTDQLCYAPDAQSSLVVSVLDEIERAGITYCVLRGGSELMEQAAGGDVDVLIAPDQLTLLRQLLARLGFVRLKSWGHAPHHFFVAYDKKSDRWLKLDVVTSVACGRPKQFIPTQLAEGCLKRRRRWDGWYVPAAEDELVALLLHCVVDKRAFSPAWRRRIVALAEEAQDDDYLTGQLARHWSPSFSAASLRNILRAEQWEKLVADRPAVVRRLTAGKWIATAARCLRDIGLRKLNRVAQLLRPRAISVALMAPDGAGKSTLASGVRSSFFFPVQMVYMGLYQKKHRPGSRRVLGLGLAAKLLTQWQRYLRAHLHRARGHFVIFDRYTYDALLPAPYRLSRFQKMRRWLLARACPKPNLILLLDAPGELLFERKGEHSVEYLEQHRAAYLKLQQRYPSVVVVDATQGADDVRRQAISKIWRRFAERSDRLPPGGHARPG